MTDTHEIIRYLDSCLTKTGREEIGAVEANAVLAKAGLLSDSMDRPGKPLRTLLRKGEFPHAYRRGGNWVIPHSKKSKKPITTDRLDRKNEKTKAKTKTPNVTNKQSSVVFRKFHRIDSIVLEELNACGFYCIKLRKDKKLPEKYHKHLSSNRFIYIGKAQGQTLRERLYNQELNAIGHGTFFRSIGAVLGYLPPKGSLINKKNKRNYTFSQKDTADIIEWMRSNLEVCWIKFDGDFSIEKHLIEKHCPLLNLDHNPNKLEELKKARQQCRDVANSV